MINYEKNQLNGENLIILTKDNKTLQISRPYNLDIVISLLDQEYPSVFSVDLSDENLYLIIDRLYNSIKESNSEELFYSDIVDYRGDYLEFKSASRLMITREQGTYRIIFFKSKEKNNSENTVVISNENSRYGKGSEPFFRMYEDLNNYDFKTRRLVK